MVFSSVYFKIWSPFDAVALITPQNQENKALTKGEWFFFFDIENCF